MHPEDDPASELVELARIADEDDSASEPVELARIAAAADPATKLLVLARIAEELGKLYETPAGSKVTDFAVEMCRKFKPDRSFAEFQEFADRAGKLLGTSASGEGNDLEGEKCPELTPAALMRVGWRMDFNNARRLDAARLDEVIRCALKKEPPPELVLILDRDHSTLLGERIPMRGWPRQDIEMLWVLAENADHPVEREILKEESGTDRDIANLKFIVTGLRRRLQLLIKAYYEKTGVDRLPRADDSFIVGERGGRAIKKGKEGICPCGTVIRPDKDKFCPSCGKRVRRGKDVFGPYTLMLSPLQVCIKSERPVWMKPKLQ